MDSDGSARMPPSLLLLEEMRKRALLVIIFFCFDKKIDTALHWVMGA